MTAEECNASEIQIIAQSSVFAYVEEMTLRNMY